MMKKALFLLLFPLVSFAQQTVVRGIVRDRKTNDPIPFANIYLEGDRTGVVSDLQGQYTIKIDQLPRTLCFSSVGYTLQRKIISLTKKQTINIFLKVDAKVLNEVVVKSKRLKEHYRNKDNPAVQLIRSVIKNKEKNRFMSYDYMHYEEYEKLILSWRDNLAKIKKKKYYKRYKFLFDNADTVRIANEFLLPLYFEETISRNYFQREPKKEKKIILAHEKVNYDKFFDTEGIGNYIKTLYQNVDIYDNTIMLLENQFIGPISNVSPMFYKFYITDTLVYEQEKLYELTFVPRNKEDLLFQGTMYITADNRFAVRRLNMLVNTGINLNWVRDLRVTQDFEKTPEDRYRLSRSTISIDFAIAFTDRGGGFLGERTVSFKDIVINEPWEHSVKVKKMDEKTDAEKEEMKIFLAQHRHEELSETEANVYENVEGIKKIPSLNAIINILTLISSGYENVGPVEIGPVGTFFSFNDVEGFRLKVGGRTTSKLNKWLYVDSYVGYGFKDRKWKYQVGATYSFTGKFPLNFPVKALYASYQREIKVPGYELDFLKADNILVSIRRGKNDKWTYNRIWTMQYRYEFKNHFSFQIGGKHWVQEPAGSVFFVRKRSGGDEEYVSMLTTSEMSLELRWAPHEEFYQGKKFRVPIKNKYPIIRGRLIAGVKGLLGGEYTYYNLTLNGSKRFYLSQIGFMDVVVEGGYIFGQVPFPLLTIHRANQSYFYQSKSYNLMNFLEFVSDRYAALYVTHHFNGFFFNKIPLLKKMKLREIVSFKLLYGGVRDENLPTEANSLFLFSGTEKGGDATTYSLDAEPYMEFSVGIDNIFRFFRIDSVWRLSYLNHRNVPSWGIRGRFSFYF